MKKAEPLHPVRCSQIEALTCYLLSGPTIIWFHLGYPGVSSHCRSPFNHEAGTGRNPTVVVHIVHCSQSVGNGLWCVLLFDLHYLGLVCVWAITKAQFQATTNKTNQKITGQNTEFTCDGAGCQSDDTIITCLLRVFNNIDPLLCQLGLVNMLGICC